jgi:diguanylate cyclase (GGDEF)-like protein
LLGVWTRAAFESAVARQIASSQRRGEPLFLAVLDFVRLRAINDRWGHLAGDAVLAHLARTVRDNLRPQDQLGRFGGDELAILLVGGDLTAAEEAMTALLQGLATAPFERGALSVPLEVAIGLTPVLEDEASGERAFARALSALRRARQARQPMAVASGERDREHGRTGSETSVVFEVGAYSGIPSGSTIGGMYRILHEISRGAMGVVYRGEDLGLGRPVAIKVLRADLARDRGLVARFREEAAVLASLRHRNLVQVYAFGEDGDDVFFVMELVEGEPLSDVIDRLVPSGALVALDAVCKIVEEIAEALEAMHAAGIIHRDVKPANVLLDRINDRAVLVDVGVARRAHEATDAAGTPGFAAPESFTDTPESAATDVYGLATTAYAMLTGGPPFGAGEVVAMVNRQLFEPVPPISRRRRGLSAELDTLMARALAAEPEDRHRSANAFAIALTRALTGDTGFEQASTLAKVPSPVVARADTGSGARFETAPITGRGPSPLDRDESSVGESHGAFFSVARRLLSHQIGEQATRRIAASSLTLTRLLDSGLSATGWRPIEDLLELLAGVAAHIDAPRFAFRLGRSMISATLTHTFGADPRSVPALDLIRAAPSYWPRYHRWGHLTVETGEPRVATVVLEDKPDDPLLCALVGGMLVRIPELAGSGEAAVSHPSCVSQGASVCRFRLGY